MGKELEEIIKVLLSGATVVAAIGYVVHSIYMGYCEFKKDAYAKLNNKVDKDDCRDFRRYIEKKGSDHDE